MIRIDEIWLSTQPLDMRAGMDTVMAQVVRAFGYIKPHCAYLFCNKRGHRMKVLVHSAILQTFYFLCVMTSGILRS
ncbi:IS66 family insertion sequence element accessory protein TnpB [Acinetobacter sp. NCu2D-2]|uniref:IS66 family insertion sequence element accessory protein TnpB n=1 Tax=Acinetobacter sp. NCu2D-2 TaxID=1608473 RepID=UPI000B2CE129|nr:IS66 family insertion sequence element accessory protein TnpB [Acinetobacter sp. NCu2D-2]